MVHTGRNGLLSQNKWKDIAETQVLLASLTLHTYNKAMQD